MLHAGLDPLKFLELREQVDLDKWRHIQAKWLEIRDIELQNLAKYIAREVNKMFPKAK